MNKKERQTHKPGAQKGEKRCTAIIALKQAKRQRRRIQAQNTGLHPNGCHKHKKEIVTMRSIQDLLDETKNLPPEDGAPLFKFADIGDSFVAKFMGRRTGIKTKAGVGEAT